MRRLPRLLITVAGSLLIAVFIGLAAAGGWFYWDRVESQGEVAARAALPRIVAREIPQVFGYDYQTVERSLAEVYPWLTPEFRQEFQKMVNTQVIPEAKKREVVRQANVVGLGVMTANRDSGSVLVYLNLTSTDKTRQPVYDGSRVRVDFKRIGGQWLISYITPI
jgi:Mce-associated membrane protein